MRFSRYIAKRIFSALNACIHKLRNILFHSVPARDRKNKVLEVQCKHLTVLSAIRKLNLFSPLITGKTSLFFNRSSAKTTNFLKKRKLVLPVIRGLNESSVS